MSNRLVVVTETEPAELFLVQGKETDQILAELRTERYLTNRNGSVWELKPSLGQFMNTSGLVRMTKTGETLHASPAEDHFQRFLYYARIDGSRKESEVLGRFCQLLLNHLKDAKAKEDRIAGAPVVKETLPPVLEKPKEETQVGNYDPTNDDKHLDELDR